MSTEIKSFSIISSSKLRRVSGVIDGREICVECKPTATDEDCRAALLKAAGATTKTPPPANP